jgi:hyperosmotically inducible protein
MKKNLHLSIPGLILALAGAAFAFGGCTTADAGGPPDDAAITERVKSDFAHNDHLVSHPIKVRTENGVVHLSGLVATQSEKTEAEKDAMAVGGVKSVVNNLVVSDFRMQ